MIKYRDKKTEITIDLPEESGHDGYSVICGYSFDKNEGKYLVTMKIQRNDIGDTQIIDSQYVEGDRKAIDYNIRRIVEDASLSGYFDKYISRYEYTYKCFDKGNEFFENELYKKSHPVKKGEIIRIAYYCSNCGAYVEETNKHCPHCNVELDWNDIIGEELE